MKDAHFLHVSFHFKQPINIKAIEAVFNKASDWIHYMPNCWIIKTKGRAQKWYELLKPCLGPKDNVFICEIDLSERQGWLPKWVWDWIKKQNDF